MSTTSRTSCCHRNRRDSTHVDRSRSEIRGRREEGRALSEDNSESTAAPQGDDDRAAELAESVEQQKLIGSANQTEAVRSNLEKRAARYAD